MLAEQTRHRQRKSHRPPSGIYHAPMDPEQQTRLDMLIAARHMERAYAGELVEPHILAQPGARARLEACLEPSFFAKMIFDRVQYRETLQLEAIRGTYPVAYAVYSAGMDTMLQHRCWEREQERRAELRAFAPVEDTP